MLHGEHDTSYVPHPCTPEEIETILLNKASIGQITASELEGPLGVPANFWIERQRRYDESRAKRIDSK
jgi:plasmid maintenance system antidote protein VapI